LILDKDVHVKKGVIVIRRLKKAQEKDGYREYVYSADKRVLDCVDVAKRWKTHKHIEKNPFLFASNRKLKTVGAERLSQLRSLNGWQAVSRFTAHRMFQRVTTSLRFAVELRQSHVLRHTRAVMMLAAGAPPEQVQKLLGHATLRMTARYEEAAQNVRSQLSAEFLNMGLGL
jgi:integrase